MAVIFEEQQTEISKLYQATSTFPTPFSSHVCQSSAKLIATQRWNQKIRPPQKPGRK
jgi:hypothetical protein